MKKFFNTVLKTTGLLAIAAMLIMAAPAARQWVGAQWIRGYVGIGPNPGTSAHYFHVEGSSYRSSSCIQDDDSSASVVVTDTTVAIDANEGVKIGGARFTNAIGDTVASANNLVLGYDGSVFPISGTTTINGISTTDWPSGSVISLFFNASVTVADSASVTTPYQELNLSGGNNLSATKNDVLTLILNGTEWFEVSRTVNAD